MDALDLDRAIEEDLEKLSMNLSDVDSDSDTDIEEDFTASNKTQENDLPDSVLAYFKASSTRVKAFEQVILEDLDDLETMCNEMYSPSQHADHLTELGSNFEDDPLKLKERILSEIEEQVDATCETHDSNGDYDAEYETHKQSESQLMFEWRKLEERLRKEEEQRLAELETEREQCLKSAREEEEKRRHRSEQFNEELRRNQVTNQDEYLNPVEGESEISESLQLEMVKQKELIKRLEEQIEEERRVFKEVQQEERRRFEARCTAAATKLQAAFRGTLVRRWSKKELTKRREEEKRREREERMKMEWEKERRRVEQEEQCHREEAERRRAEYERAKEQERHRLERERRLEEQRRKEKEEATRIEDERKRKEEEKWKRREERGVEEKMRNFQEEKIKKGEKAKRTDDEMERKEEVKMIEERRVKEKWRNIQEDEEKKSKEKAKAKAVEEEIKRKDLEGLPQRIEERRMEEERRNVHEDEENTRTTEEKAKWIQDEIKRKDEGQKGIEIRRVEEEKKRKEVEEAKRREDERKRKDEEKQKEMEERRVEEERKRKEVEEAKRIEDERKGKEEEKQKSLEISRVEEEERKIQEKEKKRKEEEKEKKTEAEINRKEEEERQKRKNEKGAVEEMKRLKQKEQLDNETEPVQKEQSQKGEETVININNDGQNMEEGSRNIIKDKVKGSIDKRENPETDKGDNISHLRLSQSVNMSKRSLTLSPRNGQDEHHSCHLASTLSTDKSSVTVSPSEEKSVTDTRGPQCALDDSSSACLPDSTEQKRLAWMMNCTSWSKLSMQNKRKGHGAPPKRRGRRRASGHSLLPLPVDTVLRSGPWSCLKQVTSVTLEDLPSCSISTLSECTRLQSLTLRRCGLQALNGLNQCAELQHIDLQENNITYIDCGGLARLEVLLLGRNQLMSIHGLDDAVNLTVLQLSHNVISRIDGLGSLKKLHRLTLDHNQLISTRGLSEAFTLLHLDCSYNHLNTVEGLESCALLNTLDLRGNSLTELPVLKNHVLLRELYLDDNSICSLHGLDSCWLPLLCCLSASQNSITQLPLLMDLLSLKTLNVSNNCLSELRNICMSLQGCAHLQELNITDNPVQEENNWRSSVLAVNPSLIKLNAEQTGASGTLSADSTQLWSFQALCQTHQDQIDSVLQRHSMEIGSAPSALHAQLLVGNHAGELFQLAEKQRYAHEYGDSGVCETAMQEPVASSCLQELSEWDLAQEKRAEAKSQHPAVHTTQSWEAPHLPNFTQKCQPSPGDHNAGCTESTESPTQKFRDTQLSKDGYSRYAVQASRMDLKTVAALVIQRCWREHRQRRRMGHLRPPAKAHARLSPQRDVKSCETRPECLNKDYAATVIQAAWRGYLLRKTLTRALMLAQISEADEAFEEVDMDEFIFDEEAMERDWTTLGSDMSPSSVLPPSQQPPLPKPLPPLPELQKSATVQPWKPRQAWISDEEAPVAEHQSLSPDPNTRMRSPASTMGKSDLSLSERSDKIMEEWGISSGSTGRLMLKRAQRMKARKQQYQKKLRDPVVRLALFRNRNMRPVVMETQRSRPAFKEEIKAGRADVSAQEVLRGESEQMQIQTRHRTYQWLQTQSVLTRGSSAPSVSDHFLPEIDPEILSTGRVQLVASTGYREAPDVRQWIDGTGFSSPQNHQTHTRTHSAGHSKKEVPSPQKVTLAPSRKERISFRDNPVQLSGGWGGGKKRSNANKLK